MFAKVCHDFPCLLVNAFLTNFIKMLLFITLEYSYGICLKQDEKHIVCKHLSKSFAMAR